MNSFQVYQIGFFEARFWNSDFGRRNGSIQSSLRPGHHNTSARPWAIASFKSMGAIRWGTHPPTFSESENIMCHVPSHFSFRFCNILVSHQRVPPHFTTKLRPCLRAKFYTSNEHYLVCLSQRIGERPWETRQPHGLSPILCKEYWSDFLLVLKMFDVINKRNVCQQALT